MATASVDGGQSEADVHEFMGGPQMRREDQGSRIADGGDDGLLRLLNGGEYDTVGESPVLERYE